MIPSGRFSSAFITHDANAIGDTLPGALGGTAATHKLQWEASKLQSATGCRCEDFILFPSLFKALNWYSSSWKIMDVLAMVRIRCLLAVDADSSTGTITYLQTTMWLYIHSPFVMSQVTSWEFFKRENPILRERKKNNLGS